MNRTALLILGALTMLLAGCASSRPSQFYTLSPSAISAGAASTDFSVSVGPVSIPDAVDRPQIVVRTGPNKVLLAEYDRWASPLKSGIARVVAENLVSTLGTPKVSVFPQASAAEATYRVGINVLQFESEPGKGTILDVLWTVSSGKNGPVHGSRTTISEPVQGEGYAEVVAAHSRALGRLSGQIAKTIQGFEARKP